MDYQAICSALKEARERAGLTAEELGRFFGAGEELVERWESGLTEPTLSECLVLCRLYGRELEELAGDFDVRAAIPADCRELYDRKRRENRLMKRWG